MPLSTTVLNLSFQWSLFRLNAGGYGKTNQGLDSLNFNLAGIDNTVFNQLYASQLSLAASASTTLDMTSLTNLVYETFAFMHVAALIVLPVGSQITVSPGASNGLQLFGGSSQSVIVPDGGLLLHSTGPLGPGILVDGTHKNLTFLNSGATSVLADIAILGSTT